MQGDILVGEWGEVFAVIKTGSLWYSLKPQSQVCSQVSVW